MTQRNLTPRQVDATGLPDGKIFTTLDEEWVAGDLPAPPEGAPILHSSASWNVATVGMTVLNLAATPYEESLHIFKNGLMLRPGSGYDYTVSGTVVTFATALADGDLISDRYWTDGTPGESVLPALPSADVIAGSFIHLNYDYDYSFTLPSGVLSTDLMLCAWNNWHGWSIDTGAGWVPDYYPNGNTVVCHKFVGSATAGTVVSPSTPGQGYRAAGQMVLVRGADQTNPIYAVTTGGASIAAGSLKRRVIHLVEQGTGGPDPTLSRGTEMQHAYDGTLGVRASHEEVAAGASVACSTNAGFLASVAIKAV